MKVEEASILYLPIEISKTDLEYQINQTISGVVYEDVNIDDDGFMFKAEKIGNITIDLSDSAVKYKVPLKIWVKKDIGVTNVEATGKIALDFSSGYTINSGWHLKTETKVDHYEWIEKPKMKLALFDVSIKLLADKILNKSEEVICKSIDEQLAKRFDLRDTVTLGWQKLQTPFKLNDQLGLWLHVLPNDFMISPLQFEGDLIRTKIFLSAKSHAVLDTQLIPKSTTDLPDFQFQELEGNHFSFQLYGNAAYEKLEMLAKKYLIGKEINPGDFSIIIDNIDLKGNLEKLVMNVQVSGSFAGAVQLSGKPIFNESENQIEFLNFNYEVKAKNFLMKGLVWLFQKKLDEQVEKFLKLPLVKHLEKAQVLINEKLEHLNIIKNITLNGKVEKIEVKEIQLKEDHLEIILKAIGQLEQKAQPLKV